MSDVTQVIRPRIIVELQPDGTFVLETYTNGARTRTVPFAGDEWYEIKQALRAKQNEINDNEARKIARKAKEDNLRHRKVWKDVAYGTTTTRPYGEHYANKTIGPIEQLRQHPAVPVGTPLADLERICHCGQLVRPFMEKCEDCPGFHGAGKVMKIPGRGKAKGAKAPVGPTIDASDLL